MFDCGINVIYGEINTAIEDEIFKAVRNVGIDIDKKRLTQVIQDRRKAYDDGVADGKKMAKEELVRCKDCKHYDKDMIYCNLFGIQNIDDDWFCADGKPKESEQGC